MLSWPPGSGTLENDFSSFANLLTRHRSSMLSTTVEMILFCKQNFESIPDFIPVISDDLIRTHIPERLTDPNQRRALRELHANPLYMDNDSDDE